MAIACRRSFGEKSELVPCETGDMHIGGGEALQTFGEGPQQSVARRMPERVIHVLELVEIQREHRKPSACSRLLARGFQKLLKLNPVREVRQRVVQRQIGQALLRLPFLRHVGPDATIAREPGAVGEDRLSAQFPGALLAGDVEREDEVAEGAALRDAVPEHGARMPIGRGDGGQQQLFERQAEKLALR